MLRTKRSRFPGRVNTRRKVALEALKAIYANKSHIPKRFKNKSPSPSDIEGYLESVIKPQIEKLEKIITAV